MLFCNTSCISKGNLCRFLHHISHLPCQLQLALSRHGIHLNFQGVTAYAGPCQATHNTDFRLLIGTNLVILFFTKKYRNIRYRNLNLLLVPIRQKLACCLSAHFSDSTFQITHACLSGVAANHLAKCTVSKADNLLHAMLFHLFWHQMLFSNMELLIGSITIYLYYIHSVQKRSRNSRNIIGGCHKKYFGQIQWYF